jgi:phenylacetate-CoA ligase
MAMTMPHADAPDPLALGEYRPGASAVLSDEQRWPMLDDAGVTELAAWRAHPSAPAWTHATGDRLTPELAAQVLEPLPLDGWLDEHLAVARRLIRYRDMTGLDTLEDFPPVSRAELFLNVADFVPLDADLGRAVHGSSSGSTGAALVVPDDIVDVARTFHVLRSLVQAEGIAWDPDPARAALAYLVDQRDAFTFVSLVSTFGMRPMMRLNLAPHQWPTPGAAAEYLRDANPQVITGDPASLSSLLEPGLASAVQPLAIFSGAMALSAPLRAALEERFACPVFDLYGLHETRPIAVRTDNGPFKLLDRRVHVEILDASGAPVPEGELGEITVTAGENPFLPLVRYRTGDYGALVRLPDGGVGIDRFEGREYTEFVAADGSRVPAIDLTQHLQAHGAWGWRVEQAADRSVAVSIAGGDTAGISAALVALLGAVPIEVTAVPSIGDLGPGKPRRYVSEATS